MGIVVVSAVVVDDKALLTRFIDYSAVNKISIRRLMQLAAIHLFDTFNVNIF